VTKDRAFSPRAPGFGIIGKRLFSKAGIVKNFVFVWLLAVFLGGVGLAIPTDEASRSFFAVENIHDLWEIIGAIATTIGVGLAIYGYNSWKVQISAASDHELALRVAVSVRKYRVAVIATWHAAESAAVQIQGDTWIGEGGRENFLISIYQARIDAVDKARIDLESVALEAAVIWRGIFETGFDRVYLIDQKCRECIESYLSLLIRGSYDERAMTTAERALENWGEFKEHGIANDESIKALFDDACGEIDVALNNKLLKGRA
jgi:hypothetical protein